MKYELGVFDPCAAAHGQALIDEIVAKYGADKMTNFDKHSVVVCVYADGYLQFAGGNSGLIAKGEKLGREMVKLQARSILERIDPRGEIIKQEGATK